MKMKYNSKQFWKDLNEILKKNIHTWWFWVIIVLVLMTIIGAIVIKNPPNIAENIISNLDKIQERI